jgi:hypothetical protein
MSGTCVCGAAPGLALFVGGCGFAAAGTSLVRGGGGAIAAARGVDERAGGGVSPDSGSWRAMYWRCASSSCASCVTSIISSSTMIAPSFLPGLRTCSLTAAAS